MSDIKHLEYCIKLGNTALQTKLDSIRQGTYVPEIPKRKNVYSGISMDDKDSFDVSANENISFDTKNSEDFPERTLRESVESFKARLKVD